MAPPPLAFSSPEQLTESPSPTTTAFHSQPQPQPSPLPQVPDPRGPSSSAFSARARTPSPYSAAAGHHSQHSRSHSETAHLRHTPGGLHPLTEMNGHAHVPYQIHRASPLGAGAVAGHVAEVAGDPPHHSTHPVHSTHPHPHTPHQHTAGGFHASALSYGRYQSLSAAIGHPSHTPAPASSDHAGAPRRVGSTPLSASTRGGHAAHAAHRARASSGGHDRHYMRCSPDCQAAEAPYGLLTAIIGKASAGNLRGVVPRRVGPGEVAVERGRTGAKGAGTGEEVQVDGEDKKPGEDDRSSLGLGVPDGPRPNIQSRRSSKRSSSLIPSTPPPDPSASAHSPAGALPPLRTLTFDRRMLQSTPPLPPVDHIRDPPIAGDFFANFIPPHTLTSGQAGPSAGGSGFGMGWSMGYGSSTNPAPGPAATSSAILDPSTESESEKEWNFSDLQRSSSAPSVPHLAMTADHRGSDASATSAMSADEPAVSGLMRYAPGGAAEVGEAGLSRSTPHARGHAHAHAMPARPAVGEPPTGSSPQAEAGLGVSTGAGFSASACSSAGPTFGFSFDSILSNPNDFTNYLDPDMSATLRRRMQEGSRGVSVGVGIGAGGGEVGVGGAGTSAGRGVVKRGGTAGAGGRGKEVLSEAEWSFDVPLLRAMGEAVRGRIGLVQPAEHYHLVEYGCHRETPNALISETIKSLTIRGPSPPRIVSVTHQSSPDFDTRLLQTNLHSSSTSYRKTRIPSPSPLILTSFSFAGFADEALPEGTVDAGFCKNLSRLQGVDVSTPRPLYAFTSRKEEREGAAERDLEGWLKARGKEVKKGGVVVCAFAVRTREPVEGQGAGTDAGGGGGVAGGGAGAGGEGAGNPPKASPYHTSASLPTSPQNLAFPGTVPQPQAQTPMNEHHPMPANTTYHPAPSAHHPPPHAHPHPHLRTTHTAHGRGHLGSFHHHHPSTRKYRLDIWQAMSQALSPAIQRLVSLGEVRTVVAPMLVDVPYWPRTVTEVKKVLGKAGEWEVLMDGPVAPGDEGEGGEGGEGGKDAGKSLSESTSSSLGGPTQAEFELASPLSPVALHDPANPFDFTATVASPISALTSAPPSATTSATTTANPSLSHTVSPAPVLSPEEMAYSEDERREWAEAGVRIRRLCHPAWKDFKAGRIDREGYARRIATYCHSVYEGHLKKVLREKGKMDVSQCETTVQEMFKILVEKCELGTFDALEMDIGIVVLQRR
ncbi:hypothetical protein IAT38_005657 [Cryptococcus sp. DSM 104549]